MPTWGTTQAGNGLFYEQTKETNQLDGILQYEAEWNTRLLFNELHPDNLMQVLTPYEEATAEIEVQEPMPDEPLVAPPRTAFGTFSYIRGQEPPGTYTRGYQTFTGADPSGRPPAQPLPPIAPVRWVLPCHPAPLKAPTPPVPWVLTTGNVTPYDDFKPKILKEVNDFKGDSNDISWFFLKCELHFELFNRHFHYPPHKVIFCVSQLADDAEKWWELCARIIGRTQDGEQLYPTYKDFKSNLRERFWKDANEQIKRTQWEKLRQVNFSDGDQFFQQFKELTYYTGICNNKQVMIAQIKKATREMSKNTIYSADGEVPTSYKGWKARLLHMDYNWHLKQAEGTTTGCTDSKSQAPKATTPQKGGQTSNTPEKKTAMGMTYGGCSMPMDINATKAVAKCYWCGKLSHFKRHCPNVPKSREEALRQCDFYWDKHPTVKAPTLSTVEEVKEDTKE